MSTNNTWVDGGLGETSGWNAVQAPLYAPLIRHLDRLAEKGNTPVVISRVSASDYNIWTPHRDGYAIRNDFRQNIAVSNPTNPPTLSTSATGGNLAANKYYVRFTWVVANGDSTGETGISQGGNITTTGSTSTITVTLPAFPAGVTSANIYIGLVSGSETKQGNTTSTTYTQTAALVAGSAFPTINTANSSFSLGYTRELAFTNVNGVWTGGADPAGTNGIFLDEPSVIEYAISGNPDGVGTTVYHGNEHGNEYNVSSTIFVDGVQQTMTNGQQIVGTTVQIKQQNAFYRSDYNSGAKIADVYTEHIFNEFGVHVKVKINWLVSFNIPPTSSAFIGMLPLNTNRAYTHVYFPGIHYNMVSPASGTVESARHRGNDAVVWHDQTNYPPGSFSAMYIEGMSDRDLEDYKNFTGMWAEKRAVGTFKIYRGPISQPEATYNFPANTWYNSDFRIRHLHLQDAHQQITNIISGKHPALAIG